MSRLHPKRHPQNGNLHKVLSRAPLQIGSFPGNGRPDRQAAGIAKAHERYCERKPAQLSRHVVFLIVLGAVSGCAAVDQFADHSVEYNIQAERIKNQNLLNNIVRAAYRKPLQFTDLSTITGQVSLSGGGMFTVPFGGPRTGFIFSPTVTASNTPNFTVSVLNTQEFYRGILKPIDPEIIAYYLSQGFPPQVFLTLLISEITEQGKPFYNTPGDYSEFADELDELLRQGLTVQRVTEVTILGPPLSAKDVQKLDIAKLDAQNIQIVRHGAYYQLEKTDVSYHFCFLPAAGNPTGTCAEGQPGRRRSSDRHGTMGTYGANRDGRNISLIVRSVEGIIYYLGEWARQEVVYRQGSMMSLPTIVDRNGRTDILFQMRDGIGQGHAISTSYEGDDYHVDVDPKGRDRSSQTMELVLELLALNTSAKELPAPSILPVIPR